MNQSPWQAQFNAEYERNRIQNEMKQIRLGEKGTKASKENVSRKHTEPRRVLRPVLVIQVMLNLIKGIFLL